MREDHTASYCRPHHQSSGRPRSSHTSSRQPGGCECVLGVGIDVHLDDTVSNCGCNLFSSGARATMHNKVERDGHPCRRRHPRQPGFHQAAPDAI
jgi:hypothetical protein